MSSPLWSNEEVARRWLVLFPGRVGTNPEPIVAPVAMPAALR